MAYELQQLTDALQPDYVEHDDGWNNQATFYLGSGDYLDSADGSHQALLANRNPFTMYIATEATLTNGAIGYIAKAWKSTNTNVRLNVIGYQNATETTVVITMGVAGGATDTLTASVAHAGSVPKRLYICARSDGDGLWLSINDTTTAGQNDSDASLVATIATAGATFDYDLFRLGNQNTGSLGWAGSCGHFQIKDVCHSDAQVQKMFDYYEGRFGAA